MTKKTMERKKKISWALFSPKEYLLYYYNCDGKSPGGALKAILRFLAKVSKKIPRKVEYLEFGGGPTIYSLISLAPRVNLITFSDYLNKNLKEIQKWRNGLPTIIDWDPFLAASLRFEGKIPSVRNIARRKEIMKRKIKSLIHCDVRKKNPLTPLQKQFHVVGVHFCADCVTDSIKTWERNMKNISSLIRPKGWLILSTFEKTKNWFFGPKNFPSTWLTKRKVENTLKRTGFRILHTQSFNGYFKEKKDAVLLFFARKQDA